MHSGDSCPIALQQISAVRREFARTPLAHVQRHGDFVHRSLCPRCQTRRDVASSREATVRDKLGLLPQRPVSSLSPRSRSRSPSLSLLPISSPRTTVVPLQLRLRLDLSPLPLLSPPISGQRTLSPSSPTYASASAAAGTLPSPSPLSADERLNARWSPSSPASISPLFLCLSSLRRSLVERTLIPIFPGVDVGCGYGWNSPLSLSSLHRREVERTLVPIFHGVDLSPLSGLLSLRRSLIERKLIPIFPGIGVGVGFGPGALLLSFSLRFPSALLVPSSPVSASASAPALSFSLSLSAFPPPPLSPSSPVSVLALAPVAPA